MSRCAAPGTPGWLAQLKHHRQVAVTAKSLDSLRELGKTYGISLARSTTDLALWREAVTKKLDDMIVSEEQGRRARRGALQGSTRFSMSSIASMSSRRSSVSSAAPRLPARLAAAATAAAAAGSARLIATCEQPPCTPKALPPSPAEHIVVDCPAEITSPAAAPARLQAAAQVEAVSGAAAPQHASTDCALAQLQQQLTTEQQMRQQQQLQIETLQTELAAKSHEIQQLKQQLLATTGAGMRLAERVTVTELQVQELLAVRTQQAEARDSISKLHSQQEQLQQRQRLDECQLSVVFKDAKPLPAQGAASHLQQLLTKQLQLSITVQRVQPLGSNQHDRSSMRSRHAYKVTLGSGGERTAVLRAKARGLRGTTMSIDALLTPDQLASKHQLLPVARQAKAAGQAVRWRYGTLLIDGKQYTGPGSLPTPAEQHAAKAASTAAPTAEQEGGWQTVQHKKKQPAAPKQQQKGGGAAPKQQQKSGSAAQKQQQKGGSAAQKQQQKGSTAANSAATESGSQQPAGRAGGSPARVASQGLGKEGTCTSSAQPVAGHGVGPSNAESPPVAAAADGSSQQPAAGEVAAAAAGAGASSAPPSTSPARA